MLIRILGQAAGGKVASQDVVALIGFSTLNYLPIILILTSFISVLLVIDAHLPDSEMVVWFASGLSLTAWIRPVLSFGLPLVLVVALLSAGGHALGQPAKRRIPQPLREARRPVQGVAGPFQESSSADRVFFVEGLHRRHQPSSRTCSSTASRDGKSSIIVAREGVTEVDAKGDQFLVLKNGRRYDGTPAEADFQ